MKVIIDTCTFLWAALEPDRLSAAAKQILTAPGTEVGVSAISCGEIACAAERNKLELDRHWRKWIRFILAENDWEIVSINLEIIEEAYCLPGDFHKDPADRIIVATSRIMKAPVVTGDALILRYAHVESVW